MGQTAREEILGKLRAAPRKDLSARPAVPSLNELSLNAEQLIEKFTENVIEQTGVVHRVKDRDEAIRKLTEIAESEHLARVMVSTDDVVAPMELSVWGKSQKIDVFSSKDFDNRNDFKHAVFEEVDAGITGVDFAVAESGTLCLVHDKDQPRLVSLAPIMHIAILPVDRLYPVYESVVDDLFGGDKSIPNHVTFITGPSMTGDIQGVPFKGMHGPKRLIVIMIG
jgi:L-lactate dehydrogenase complex protein LldG